VITFVLVPGACHGGWWYEPLARQLEHDGHAAVPITLAGLEDQPRLDRLITLNTHVDQVAAAVPAAGQVALVGHSYAGSVITAVADRLPARIAALVYLDAFLPEDGDSCWIMTNDEQRQWYATGCARTGYGADPLPFFSERARPHPVATFLQALALTGAWRDIATKHYVAAQWPGDSPDGPVDTEPTPIPASPCTTGTSGTTCWPTAQPASCSCYAACPTTPTQRRRSSTNPPETRPARPFHLSLVPLPPSSCGTSTDEVGAAHTDE